MPADVSEPTAPQLFRKFGDAMGQSCDSASPDEMTVRSRIVELNVDALPSAFARAPQLVLLNLFDDVEVLALIDPPQHPSPNCTSWWGAVQTCETGSINFVLVTESEASEECRERTFAGNVRASYGAFFSIRSLGGDRYIVRQRNLKALPPRCESVPPPEAPPVTPEREIPLVDDGSRFDIAIFYTQKARAGAGGTNRIRAEINLAVSETNRAYRDSRLSKTMRLVHREEIQDDEGGGFQAILDRLTSRNDGAMDAVHSLRSSFGADLVSLFVQRSDMCGKGHLMSRGWNRHEFEVYAFSVVNRDCVGEAFSLAHETGHNMGCGHDLDNPIANPLFQYCNGHHFTFGTSGELLHTLMAYDPGDIIGHFSNPDVRLGGFYATGVANVADHARVIRNTSSVVANFRSNTRLALRTAHGQFVSARAPNEGWIVMQAPQLQSFEVLELISFGNSMVAFRSVHNGYLSARPANENWKVTQVSDCLGWEQFQVISLGGGRVAYRTSHGRYLSARLGDENWVIGQVADRLGWEEFTPQAVTDASNPAHFG